MEPAGVGRLAAAGLARQSAELAVGRMAGTAAGPSVLSGGMAGHTVLSRGPSGSAIPTRRRPVAGRSAVCTPFADTRLSGSAAHAGRPWRHPQLYVPLHVHLDVPPARFLVLSDLRRPDIDRRLPLEQPVAPLGIYRLRLGSDRYVHMHVTQKDQPRLVFLRWRAGMGGLLVRKGGFLLRTGGFGVGTGGSCARTDTSRLNTRMLTMFISDRKGGAPAEPVHSISVLPDNQRRAWPVAFIFARTHLCCLLIERKTPSVMEGVLFVCQRGPLDPEQNAASPDSLIPRGLPF